MLTLLQIKTPLELVKDLQTVMEDLMSLHRKEIEELEALNRINALKARTDIDQRKLVEDFNLKQARIRHRATRLTMQNILRHFLMTGIKQYRGKLPLLLSEINNSGISRGRPKSE